MPYNDGLEVSKSVSLTNLSLADSTVELNGATYKLKPMALGDYAAALQYIRDRRINAVLEGTSNRSEELRAKAIAEVISQPMDLIAIWKEFDGECIILQRALLKDGRPVPLKYIMEDMNPGDRRVLNQILLHVCGIATDPTPPVESNGTPPTNTQSQSVGTESVHVSVEATT